MTTRTFKQTTITLNNLTFLIWSTKQIHFSCTSNRWWHSSPKHSNKW